MAQDKKKPVDVTIDTPNVDATLHTDGEGNLEATLDTKHLDVEVKKDEDGLHVHIDLNDDDEVEFVSNGKAGHMPKGTIWKVTGEFAKIFLKQGLGKLKK